MTASLFRIAPWLALIGVAWFGGCQYARNREADARSEALRERIAARETVIAALAKQKAKVDTQYVPAKASYVKAVQGWDSIKVVLGPKATIDPVVLAGDRLAAACAETVQKCEARVAVRDTLLAEKDSIIAAKDSLLDVRRGSPWKTKLGWLLAGAAVGVLVQ